MVVKHINKIIWPVAIIVASLILGGFYFVTQRSKQESIERQQQLKLEAEEKKDYFDNEIRCQSLLKDLKQRWNNVVGVYYGEYGLFNPKYTCIVKFTKDGEVHEAPVGDMQDSNE